MGIDMRTLDEVIKAQERCETYPDCHFCYLHAGPMCEWIRDALAYLKMYRSDKLQWEADRKNWNEQYKQSAEKCEKAAEKHLLAIKELKKKQALFEEAEKRHFEAADILEKRLKDHQAKAAVDPNEPLAWDELKAMEGKPVWIEDRFGKGEWFMINRTAVRLIVYDRWGDENVLKQEDMMETWIAYRKERKQ